MFKTAPVQFNLAKVSAAAADGARRGLAQLRIHPKIVGVQPALPQVDLFSHSYGDDWDCFKTSAAAAACSLEANRYFWSGMCQMTGWTLLLRIHCATSLGCTALPALNSSTPLPGPELRSVIRASKIFRPAAVSLILQLSRKRCTSTRAFAFISSFLAASVAGPLYSPQVSTKSRAR